MFQIINKLKSRFSFLTLQIFSLIVSPLLLPYIRKSDIGNYWLFTMVFTFLGFSSIIIIIYILELGFPNFRISQKITKNSIYNTLFFILLPITVVIICTTIVSVIFFILLNIVI